MPSDFTVAAGRDSVTIDGRWSDGVAVEVEKAVTLFEQFVNEQNLQITVHCRYRRGVDLTKANKLLGFVPATPITWAGGTVGSAMTVPELDEFTVGINLAE